MDDLKKIEKEVTSIKERNEKVETDKAWETSLFRKIIIAFLTYIVIVIFFFFMNLSDPFINAIVPTLAFIISTFSVNLFKKLWIKYWYKK